jgi:hypothetical protein
MGDLQAENYNPVTIRCEACHRRRPTEVAPAFAELTYGIPERRRQWQYWNKALPPIETACWWIETVQHRTLRSAQRHNGQHPDRIILQATNGQAYAETLAAGRSRVLPTAPEHIGGTLRALSRRSSGMEFGPCRACKARPGRKMGWLIEEAERAVRTGEKSIYA